MQHPRWREGRLSTGFIAEEYPDGFHADRAGRRDRRETLAAVAAAIDHVLGERKRRDFRPDDRPRGDARASPRWSRLGDGRDHLDVGRETRRHRRPCRRRRRRRRHGARAGSTWKPGEPVWRGMVDGEPIAVQVRPVANGLRLAHRGVETRAHVYTEREAAAARLMPVKQAPDTCKALLCPMPGLVVLDRRGRARRSRPARRSPWSRR